MKPGSILKWSRLKEASRLSRARYILIKQNRHACASDDPHWLLYDVEDGRLFLASETWMEFIFEEAT